MCEYRAPYKSNSPSLLLTFTTAQNPARTPHPEQTASILSLAFYAFLDPTVFRAHRASHLPFDLFPPLADYDAARYLRARNFPVRCNYYYYYYYLLYNLIFNLISI
jgi:hypothetical protein